MAITKIRNGLLEVVGAGNGIEILRLPVESGVTTVTADGTFGGASVDFGYLGKSGGFVPWQSDTELPLSADGQATIMCGDVLPLYMQVSSTSATTNIQVTSGLVRGR